MRTMGKKNHVQLFPKRIRITPSRTVTNPETYKRNIYRDTAKTRRRQHNTRIPLKQRNTKIHRTTKRNSRRHTNCRRHTNPPRLAQPLQPRQLKQNSKPSTTHPTKKNRHNTSRTKHRPRPRHTTSILHLQHTKRIHRNQRSQHSRKSIQRQPPTRRPKLPQNNTTLPKPTNKPTNTNSNIIHNTHKTKKILETKRVSINYINIHSHK